MKLKTKLSRFREQLVNGELAQEQPQLAQMIGWGLNFVLGMVLAAVPLLNGCGPFGIAAVAQAGGSVGGLLCTLGASLGYLLFFGFEDGIKYVAAVVLVFTAAYVFQELKAYRSVWFMPLIAAFFTFVTCILGSFTATRGQSALLMLFLQAILAAVSCYFFRDALTVGDRDTETAELRHTVSLTVLIACALMAFSGAQIAGTLSLGRFCALLLVMTAACKGGAFSGCATGTALGLAMDICAYNAPLYAMAYAVCGLLSGVFSRHGRPVFALSFVLTAAVCTICASFNGLRPELLYESLLAGGIFLILPNRFLNLMGSAVRPMQMSDGESGLRRYTARRVRRIGEAFRDLYATVDSVIAVQANDENISTVFDRASELVCSRCKRKNECWNSGYLDTLAVFNDTTAQIRRRGLLLKGDLPERFLADCLAPEALVGAINGELRGQLYRRQFRARMEENRTAAYSQYADMAEVLSGVSEELLNSYGPDALARRRLLRYLATLDVDADVSVFRDRSGRMHIVLESARLKYLLREPGYLDRISGAVGVRLCRPAEEDSGGEGRVTLMEAEPLAVSVGIASLKKKGESVSGDRGTYFKTDQGVLCIILSDGMGSGENAAKESVAAVRILERFLRAGVEPSAAMKILNSMMLLKNSEGWGFATVDLMCIDLFSGEAVFYKYGAAPSYVRSGKTVRRIRSETLAAGLKVGEDAPPDMVRLRLKPGNLALIASDGVIAETNDAWLRTLLAEYDSCDAKALARDTLQAALKQYGSGDDMTVLAVYLSERK